MQYQWRKDGSDIPGATGSTGSGSGTFSLTLTNIQLAQTGHYSIVVTTPGGSVTSSPAALSLYGAPESWQTAKLLWRPPHGTTPQP